MSTSGMSWLKETFLEDHSAFWSTVRFTKKQLGKLEKKVRKLYNVEERIVLASLKELKKEEEGLNLVSSEVLKEVTEIENLIKACVEDYNSAVRKNYSVLKKLEKHHINTKLKIIETNLNSLQPDMNEMLKTRQHKVFLHYLEDMKQSLSNVLSAIGNMAELINRIEKDRKEMDRYLVTKEELRNLWDDFH